MEKTLNDLQINQTARIKRIDCRGEIRHRLFDVGLVPESKITPVFCSPFNSPRAYEIKGSVFVIRKSDCQNIIIYE